MADMFGYFLPHEVYIFQTFNLLNPSLFLYFF